uniref:Uncharacterized protein n=1 Tax=Setaria viridis TaxID=4556 RepID=A0A4U6SPY9_SETVI|nr:hypothetical protein SEVIR_9G035266v2 [Setaria viridis]
MPPLGDPDASLARVAFEIGYLSLVLGRFLCGGNYSTLRNDISRVRVVPDWLDLSNSRPWIGRRI